MLTRAVFACLAWCLVAPAAPAAAQDVSRVAASLTSITGGDDNDARREAIASQLRVLGVEPALETFGDGRTAGANVVVTVPGPGMKTFVIGAHLDRVPVGRGAIDNAAACAALLELVAAFKASPLARATLQIVFFDREESGLLGSRAFFNAGRRPAAAVLLAVGGSGVPHLATASPPHRVAARVLRVAAESVGLPVRLVPRASYPDSDHLTMMNAGIETLGLALVDAADVDGVLNIGVGGLTPGAGPRVLTIIHTPNDTMAAVRLEQMVRGIALVERLIRRLDAAGD